MTRTLRRTIVLATAVTGIAALSAATASAHHCYKEEWQEAAHSALQKNSTAWVSLSDLGRMFLIPPELQEQCGHTADEAVSVFMAERGMAQEPMIHSKATTGNGAFYKKGMEPRPFNYLSEADFEDLTVTLSMLLDECAGELPS